MLLNSSYLVEIEFESLFETRIIRNFYRATCQMFKYFIISKLRIPSVYLVLFSSFLLMSCNTSTMSIEEVLKKARVSVNEVYRSDVDDVKESVAEVETSTIKFLDFNRDNAEENVRLAVSIYPSLSKAVSEIKSAEARVDMAKSMHETQSSVSLNSGYLRDNGTTDAAVVAQFSLSRILYDYGAISSGVESSEYLRDAIKQEAYLKADEVALSAYTAWISMVNQREILSVYKEGIALAEPLLGQIENISTSGLTDKATALAAQQKFEKLKLGYEQVELSLVNAESSFSEYFPGVDFDLVENLGDLKVSLEEDDLMEQKMFENSKYMNVSELVAESRKLEIKSLIASAKPSMAFAGSATAPAEDLQTDGVASLGLIFNYTFNDGGKNEAQIESLKAELSSLLQDQKEKSLQMRTQLALLSQQYRSAMKREESLLKMFNLAQEVKDTAKAQLVSGRSKIEDVMNAEVVLSETKIDLISVRAETQMTGIKLIALIEGLTEKIGWELQ